MSSTSSNQSPATGKSRQPSNCQHAQNEQNSATSEPFPNLEVSPPFQYHASLHPVDAAPLQARSMTVSQRSPSPLSAGLRLQTEHLNEQKREEMVTAANNIPSEYSQQTNFNAGLPVRTSSIRSALTRAHRSDSLSPASARSSPGVGPLVDMTPLPSPISGWGTPGYGRRSIDSEIDNIVPDAAIVGAIEESMAANPMNYSRSTPKKLGTPTSLDQARIYDTSAVAFSKNRSISDYVPEGIQVPQARNIVVSTSGTLSTPQQSISPPNDHMHREQHLAVQRGLAITIPRPPTPPDSNRGKGSDEMETTPASGSALKGPIPWIYEAHTVRGGKLKKWRALRQLGKGTFSTVMLATSEGAENPNKSLLELSDEEQVNRKTLVAVKICEHGPAGGADEKSIGTSIKREVEIMKSIHHPSLVQLKAVEICEQQTFLVLNYCPGGDLFELANLNLDVLSPSLIRRIFTELVAAVRYLHLQYIVHRDIKLENILVNLPTAAFHTIGDWQKYPHPVVTLTDLGLGRYIPRPPESPLLERRCGSEDYAAPEVLMGQEYDGRNTDAWALGVVLYALMEGRLPFDPVPRARRNSPTSHRIARCEWQWVRFADKDGEWDPNKGQKLEGAREIVEGLLARTRSRWSLEKVQKTEWVVRGIMIDGDLQREDDDERQE